MTAPPRVSPGSSVQLGQPSFPPTFEFVDRLRRAVAADPAAAAYVISIAVLSESARLTALRAVAPVGAGGTVPATRDRTR